MKEFSINMLWDHLGCIKLVKEDIMANDWIIEQEDV